MMNNVQLSDQTDQTIWRWTPDDRYSAKSTYTMLHAVLTRFQGHHLIWKTSPPPLVKILLWLAFRRRHWTADRRRRHDLEVRDTCFLCEQEQETIDHIIACCPFTRELWHYIVQALKKQAPQAQPTVRRWWRQLRLALELPAVLWLGQLVRAGLIGKFGRNETPAASGTCLP